MINPSLNYCFIFYDLIFLYFLVLRIALKFIKFFVSEFHHFIDNLLLEVKVGYWITNKPP